MVFRQGRVHRQHCFCYSIWIFSVEQNVAMEENTHVHVSCQCPCVESTDVDGSGCCLVIVTRGLDEHTKLISQFSLWLSDGL